MRPISLKMSKIATSAWRLTNQSKAMTFFIGIVNEHAPLKKKFIKGNQAPLMTRNLIKKENYTGSRFRNKFCKSPTKENEKLYKIHKWILSKHNW